MRCLVVVAHPLPTSLSHRFAALAARELAAAGHEVALHDLYAEGFDPRLTIEERQAYYAGPHQHAAIAPHAQALATAQMLVLAFPTWWFGPPAILKGWIDRVFAPGLAFDHGENFGPIVPRLDHLRHLVAVTTLGTPWWVDRLAMRRPVRRMLKAAVLGGCAPKARMTYLPFYKAEQPDERRVAAFERRLGAALAR